MSPEDLEQQAMEQIVNQVLLQQQLQALDIKVGKQEVDQRILDTGYDYYKSLAEQGYAEEYREQIKQSLELARLRQLIENLAFVTDAEVRDTYKERNEKVKIKFVAFKNSEYHGAAEVSDDEAMAHFNKDPEAYRVSDQISIEYIKVDPASFEQNVDEQAYLDYYEENKLTEFSAPEGEIWARHILFKLEEDADETTTQDALKRAEEVAALAKAPGADFAALASEHSEGPTKTKGGDLGFFAKERMVPEFSDAAFALEEGQVSDPVKSPFGYHIIKREPKTKPYDLAKPDIQTKLQELTRDEAASAARDVARDLLYDSQAYGFEEAAKREQYKALNIEVKTTPFFSKEDSNVENLGYRWDHEPVINAAFDLRKDGVSDVVEAKTRDQVRGYFIVRVIDRMPSHIPEFDDVKDDIVSERKREKSGQLAYEAAKALADKRAASEALDSLVTKFESVEGSLKTEAKVEESDFFAYASHGYVSKLGSSPEIMAMAFGMQAGEVRGPVRVGSLGSYLVEFSERQEADLASFETNQEEWLGLYKELLTQKKSREYQAWLDSVKAHSRIERIEPETMASR